MKHLKLLLISFFFTLWLVPVTCQATDENIGMVHFLAHAGTSYATTIIGYGVFHDWIGLEPAPSLMLATALTMIGGISQETTHAHNLHEPVDGKDIQSYAIGTWGAIGTVLFFHF